jgi:PilZ domain
MESRFDTRFPSDLQVRVTDLDDDAASASGTLLDISVSGICVLLPVLKPSGSLVKLDFAETVLYGQIAYANEESGGFRTGIAVERVLVRSWDLTNILDSILDEPGVIELPPAVRSRD